MKDNAPEVLFVLVSEHGKWSLRREVQMALLRGEKTPLERAVELARNFSADVLQAIVPASRRETLIQPGSLSASGDQPMTGDQE
jgi:hypothetical protein